MLGKLKKALKSLVNEVSQRIKPEVATRETVQEIPKKETKETKKAKVISKLTEKVLYKTIDEKTLEPILEEYLFVLAEADVALEAAEGILNTFKERLIGSRIRKGEDVRKLIERSLKEALYEILNVPTIDLIEEAKRAREEGRILKLMIMGVNGVGKTTTIAKLAYMLKRAGITPVIAAADTFRAGAVEQLKKHAERIGVPIITRPYGTDPAAVVYDALEFAKARNFHVVIADTAGRMHVDVDLMNELKKIAKIMKPDYRILVIDALTGNDAVEQAKKFDEYVGVDGIILTKVDADVKGGTILSVAYVLKKPILYLGVGQRYEDLIKYNPRWVVERILGEG